MMSQIPLLKGKEFLFRPVSAKEYRSLKKSVISGSRIPEITVWENQVIDGHMIYDICSHYDISPVIHTAEFSSLPKVCSWICSRQLERKDLPNETRKYLIGCLALSVLSEETEQDDIFHGIPVFTTETMKVIAGLFHLSSACITRYSLMALQVEQIRRICPQLAEIILTERIRISLPDIKMLSEQDSDMLDEILDIITTSPSQEQIRFMEIRKSLTALYESPEKEEEQIPEIRRMPSYDPDAELNSLALTMPYWINTINRVRNSDYHQASASAIIHVSSTLEQLILSASHLKREVNQNEPGRSDGIRPECTL